MGSVAGAYITGLFNNGQWSGQETEDQLLASEMNDYIFWSLHVSPTGDLNYNNVSLAKGGTLNTAVSGPIQAMIQAAAGQGVSSFYFSIGAGGVSDWQNIETILDNGGDNQKNLFANLAQLVSLGVTGFDFDYEENISNPVGTISATAELLHKTFGSVITFCPYMDQTMWLNALQQIYDDLGTQPVVAYNLQCYSGGAGNDPKDWINTIQQASGTGVSNPPGFVRPGLAVATSGSYPNMDPSQMTSWLQQYTLSGAWIWNSEEVVNGREYTLGEYASAILAGLS